MKKTYLQYLKKIKDYLNKIKNYLNKIDKRIYIVVIIIFLIATGFYFGYIKTSKNYFLNDFEKSIKSQNCRSLKKLVTLNEQKVQDKNSLKPLVDYFNTKESRTSLITDLKKAGKWGNGIIELESKKSFFGNKYSINLKPISFLVKGNFKDIKLYLNEKEIGSIKNIDEPIEVTGLVPGKYNIKGKLDSKDFVFEKEDNITLMDKNIEYFFELDGIKVSIETPYENAEVLINGKDSNIKAKDFKDIGPFPMDGSLKLSLRNQFPWGVITSKEVAIEELPIIKIPIDIGNENLKKQVIDCANEFYVSVFEALNNESKELIKEANEDLKNKIYSILKEKYFILKNNYKINNVSVNLKQSEFKYENGVYIGNLVVDINYSVIKEVFGIQLKESKYNKNFLTSIKYNGTNWIVTNVQNFNLIT